MSIRAISTSNLTVLSRLGIQDYPSSDDQLVVQIRKLTLQLESLPSRVEAPHSVSIHQQSSGLVFVPSNPFKLYTAAHKSAKAVLSLASGNMHFDIPQAVSSIFTGREAQLDELGRTFFTPSSPVQNRNQKRFVIYGVAGSGKTQFCCKFAQDYRKQYVSQCMLVKWKHLTV